MISIGRVYGEIPESRPRVASLPFQVLLASTPIPTCATCPRPPHSCIRKNSVCFIYQVRRHIIWLTAFGLVIDRLEEARLL